MAATKGKILAEHAVTVTHDDSHVVVKFDGNTYRARQDGWTSEAGAIREAATFLLDTQGCWVEIRSERLTTNGAGTHYTMRLRVRD